MSKKIYILIAILVLLVWVSAQKVDRIECYTQYGECPDKFTSYFNNIIGKSLYLNNHHEKIAKLLVDFPSIKLTKTYRRLPNTLVITVLLRQPICQLNGQNLGIDSEGVVIASNSFSSLPNLITSEKFEIGQTVNLEIQKAAKLSVDLFKIFPEASQITYSTPSALSVNLNGSKILFDLKFIPDDWQKLLQKLVPRSKMAEKLPKTVDLRFSQPVLSF